VDLNGNKTTDVSTKNRRSLSPNYINSTTNNCTINNINNKISVKQPSSCSLSSNSSTSTLSGSNSKIFEAKEVYISSTSKRNNCITTKTVQTIVTSPVLSSYPTEHYSPRLLTSTTTLTTSDHQLIMSREASNNITSNSNSNNCYSLVDPNKIHLFVKAGQDGRSQGACPFCQDVFLQLLIKAQTNKFNFDVITINLDNPPKEFKELSIKPPVLIHGSNTFIDQSNLDDSNCDQINAIILSDVDEIAEYLDRLYANTRLTAENTEAKKVCLNVFSKFSFFIRDVSSKSTSLELELEKIDNYLKANTNEENKFLNGKTMSLLDCSLLPKLQHIRVAGESIKKFKIPARFKSLWRYIDNAYKTDAFQKSCPPDREIIWNWSKTFLTHKDLLQIMQEAPHKTLTIPDDIIL
jgi:glutathione S-transferase